MLSRAVLAVLLSGASGTAPARTYDAYDFETYLKEHNKVYASLLEYRQREELFKKSLFKVQSHNTEYNAGHHTWFASMNELADLTEEEFRSLRGHKYSPMQHPTVKAMPQGAANPTSVDWREKGAVTKVKNQGGCGSCWAFSATETLESHYQIASGKLLELAPQTLVNCVKNPDECGGKGGCEGATQELGFNLSATTGIALETDLPYEGRDETCKTYKAAVKNTGYVKLPVNDAVAFETALATKGPLAITVAAGPWQLYGGGVFSGCSHGFLGHQDFTLDHGVQAVGYTQEYWIVRNSWGAMWGEKGYIYISRKQDNATFVDKRPADGTACKPYPKTQTVGGECGIFSDSSYPTGLTAAIEGEVIV